MSISNPSVTNPVEKYIEFRSDEKRFTYFDKTKGEKGENVEIPPPFYITVLDELATIDGFNEENNCGFKSSEVHDTKKEPMSVKTWKGSFEAEGLYEEIKDKCKSAGGKFTRSIYALLSISKTEKELVNIKLKGTANGAWIDLKVKPDQNVVKFCEEFKTGKKGKTEYNIPVFELMDITPELLEEGIRVDTDVLQPYLRNRGVQGGVESNINDAEPVVAKQAPPGEDGGDGLPF